MDRALILHRSEIALAEMREGLRPIVHCDVARSDEEALLRLANNDYAIVIVEHQPSWDAGHTISTLLAAVVRERTKELELAYLAVKAANRQILLGLAEAIEAKDAYTKGHCGRVAAYSIALAHACAYPDAEMEALEYGSFLHDIGKIGVRDAVLLKPGPLEGDEWTHMRIHPVVGDTIAAQVEMLQPMR